MNKTTLTHRFTKRLPLVLIATLLAVLALAGALALLGALGTGPPVAHAWPAARPPGPAFVKPGDTGLWCLQDDPCGSIQYAIDECEPGNGDTIYVAGGSTYTGTGSAVITVTKSVTIYGGWDGEATGAVVRDPDTHVTMLDGENTRRGVFVSGTVTVTLDGLRITRGKVSGFGVEGQGGGAYIVTATVTIADCHIYSNTADKSGGGLYLDRSERAILRDNRIYSNTATNMGGGLYLGRSPATLSGNTVTGNTANIGGGLYLLHSDATLSENTITGNAGRGLSLHFSDATLVNNVVADNSGRGLFITNSSPHLLHTTIARNSGGDGSGVYVTGNSTVALTNTILVSHTVGITATTGSTATLNATLWHANDTDWGGEGTIVTGTHNYWGDPAFVDPDAGDYHIGAGSAALDKGVDAGVPTDKDSVSRPQGTAPDLGAYELEQFTLTVNKAGTGDGTVTSNPAGINCGADCTETYVKDTPVTLTATPDGTSVFAGWSGDADCTDGQVTMDADKTCIATFNLPAPIGGIAVPVNKLGLLAPWMGLVALAAVVALKVALVRRRRG